MPSWVLVFCSVLLFFINSRRARSRHGGPHRFNGKYECGRARARDRQRQLFGGEPIVPFKEKVTILVQFILAGSGSGRIGNKNLLLWACWSSFQSFWGTGFSRICNCWIFFSAEDTPSAYSSLRRFSARSLASFAPSAGGFGSAFGRPRANLPGARRSRRARPGSSASSTELLHDQQPLPPDILPSPVGLGAEGPVEGAQRLASDPFALGGLGCVDASMASRLTHSRCRYLGQLSAQDGV